MGRELFVIVKTILTAVIVCGMVIASFYFAYLLLILLILGAVSALAHRYNTRSERQWFKYEDSD
jgi:hypothetical protein